MRATGCVCRLCAVGGALVWRGCAPHGDANGSSLIVTRHPLRVDAANGARLVIIA